MREDENRLIDTVLFDLDGTLLPMDQDEFVRGYFGLLVKKMAPYGYEPQKLIDAVWSGTEAMVRNDGSRSNEIAFWERFSQIYGRDMSGDIPLFEEFYRVEFQGAQACCGFNPQAAETVRWLHGLGMRVILATNPIFPAIATESRIRWAGLAPQDFELYTTYENIGCSKPNPAYYREIIRRQELNPAACLMVGNDVGEDMVAAATGMQVFLLTDCMINKEEKDISVYPHGGFGELREFVAKNRGCAIDGSAV